MRNLVGAGVISVALTALAPSDAICAYATPPSAEDCATLLQKMKDVPLSRDEWDRHSLCKLPRFTPPSEIIIIPAWRQPPQNTE